MSDREPHPRTIVTLDKLDSVRWFANVGQKDLDLSDVLSNWDEAVSHALSLSWENLRLEAANRLRENIVSKDKLKFQDWNEIVKSVKPFAFALAADKVSESQLPTKLSDDVLKVSRWDILHLCMECEFMDVVEPGFFHALAFYYVGGHFPCGFDGQFPKGRQIVF